MEVKVIIIQSALRSRKAMGETSTAVIETTSGKIEGVFRKGLYIFRGIPYAPMVAAWASRTLGRS
jgi:hypothetical protein